MIKTLNQIVLFLFVAVWVMPLPVKAQSTDMWWQQSSLADSVRNLQFHAVGKYSLTRMQGVISGKMNSGDILLVTRKDIFTNSANGGFDLFNLNLKSINSLNYATKAYYFTDYLDVDVSKLIFAQLGFIWERDDALLLQNRYTLYGGLGINTSTFKKLKLKSLIAMGRIDQEYMIPVEEINVVKKPFTAFYTVHKGMYAIIPGVSLSGKFYYFIDLEEKDRYRYGYNLNLVVSLTKHLNLVVGYNYRFDKELVLLGLIPDNSMQNIGIEVSL
ncbi:MAG: DUF481 domain-containing protein [Bacteroidales bacterium]|nr:DUF481 domain-containing protein [Bacteroidales bacterium]